MDKQFPRLGYCGRSADNSDPALPFLGSPMRLKFSVRTALVFVGACAVVSAIASEWWQARLETLCESEFKGQIFYAYPFRRGEPLVPVILPKRITDLECPLQDNLPQTLIQRVSMFRDLRGLYLSGSNVTTEHFEGASRMPKLSTFEGRGCRDLNDDTVALICDRMPALRHLYLPGTSLTGESLHYIANLQRLESLDLSRTRTTDSSLGQIVRNCGTLRTLTVDRAALGAETLLALTESTSPTDLTIRWADVSEEGVKRLSRLQHREDLSFLGTAVTQEAIDEITNALPNATVRVGP